MIDRQKALASLRTHTVVLRRESPSSKASPLVVVDACMPKGFNETLVSPADGKEYLVVPADDGADFDACDKQVMDASRMPVVPWNAC